MGGLEPGVAVFVYLSIGAISLFSFLSVAVWTGSRKTEREAYYKAEMMKRIAEVGGEHNPALAYLREQERIAVARRAAGLKIGGLVNVGVGIGLMLMLHALVPGSGVYMVGTIPLLVGVALLVYVFGIIPKGI